MATKTKAPTKKPRFTEVEKQRMVRGGAKGLIPVNGSIQRYKAGKRLSGGSNLVGGVAVVGGLGVPGTSAAAGAYNAYHNPPKKGTHQQAKYNSRQPVKHKGRVGRK